MANKFRGEVSVPFNGKSLTLVMDYNAMADFEDLTGKNSITTFEKAETGEASISDMRAILFCAMRRHHPESTLEDAGDLLSEDITALGRLMQACAPEPVEGAQLGNAPKARAKTRRA